MSDSPSERLVATGVVARTIGPVPAAPRPAIVVWAKHPPRTDNLALLAVARHVGEGPPAVFVDDTAARLFGGRSHAEQAARNEEYVRFFGDDHGCSVTFSSEVVERGDDAVQRLVDLSARVTRSEFLGCLPRPKLDDLDRLDLAEVDNLLLELLLFEEVSKVADTLVVRHFTQSVVFTHRRVSARPLSAIVLPRMEDDAVPAFVARLAER